MGEALSADYRVIKARLSALETLLTDLDKQIGPLRRVRERQGPGMWGSVPACEKFAARYTQTLGQLEVNLLTMRDQIGLLQKALAASAAHLQNVDEGIEARIVALAKRLEEGAPSAPPVCTPYDSAPLPPVQSPAPAPTPTPAPAPTPTPAASGGGGGGW